jgi:hypothetical protein
VLFAVLTPDSAIVTSRKRKLREFFAVTNQVDPLPQDAFANPDAPATTAAEWQFLQTSEILQFVYTFQNKALVQAEAKQNQNKKSPSRL